MQYDHEPLTAADIFDAIRAGRITDLVLAWLRVHGCRDYAARLQLEREILEGLA